MCSASTSRARAARIKLPHPIAIVIRYHTTFGSNVTVFQGVTLGTSDWKSPPPRIGSDVIIGAGAIIVGDIEVGDGSIVGAGSVVTKDVPPHSIAKGNPATVRPRLVAAE